MLLVKAVRKEKAPNPGDCHGIGASLWDMPLYVEDVVRCPSCSLMSFGCCPIFNKVSYPSVISYLPASALSASGSMGIISADSLSTP